MAEKNEQVATSEPKGAEQVSTVEQKPSSTNKIIWLVFLIFVLITAGGYWLWYQQQMQHKIVIQQLGQLESVNQSNEQIEGEIKALDLNLKQQVSVIKAEQSLLDEKFTALSDSQALTMGDVEQYWALAEIEYLINFANQRLAFSADIDGAIAALVMADERVNGLSDHRLHPLRALLAEELLVLSSVTRPDIEGMALQLDSALNKVDSLQVLMAAPVHQSTGGQADSDWQDWQGVIGQAWQEIKSLVVIRKQQDGSAAVLIPEQRYFLYQNLRLKLETARFALLSGRNSVYKASLQSAAEWLELYFVGEDRDAVLELVQSLNEENIEVTMPDISASSTWLKGFKQ